MAETKRTSTVRQLWPLLAVRDIKRSIRFYCDQLGFTLVGDDGKPAKFTGWCRLERGGSSIVLQQSRDEDGVDWGRGV